MPACARSRMFDYVYTDHAQYTIKTYAKMALFPLLLTGYLLEMVRMAAYSRILRKFR